MASKKMTPAKKLALLGQLLGNAVDKKKASKGKRNSTAIASNVLSGVFDGAGFGTNSLSAPFELAANNTYTPLTLNRILLSYSYMTHGTVQTMIDQPVEDAFRGGLIFKSDELDNEDLKLLQDYFEQCGVYKEIKNAMRWAKLYGGAGLIINTNQDPKEELNIDEITPDSPLSFISADRWELTLNYVQEAKIACPYNYYGQVIHKSRVVKVMGKEAPAYIRRQLQGWGMSELERTIRPINSYVKNEDVIYELLDEAKIDVWKIQDFNANILSSLAQAATNQRLQLATMLKNFHAALIMDKEDDYEQKQISFAGLPEILNQNRIGLAAAVRMPMTKLFGLSASGFNAGEDDIENYNALIESEVRAKAKDLLHEVLPLVCKQLFDFIPAVEYEFHPLRVLSAEQEENVKTSKFNRLSAQYTQGMLTGEEYAEALKQEKIQMMDTEVSEGSREPEPPESSMTFEKPTEAVSKKVPDAG